MLPLRARVDQGAMAMKGYSAFPKAPALLEPHHQIVLCPNQDTHWGGRVLYLCRDSTKFEFLNNFILNTAFQISIKIINIIIIINNKK